MSRNRQRANSVFSSFFFKEVTPENLGICRSLFCGIILCLYLGTDFSQWAEVPDILWHPIFIFDFFHIPVLPVDILGFLGILWMLSLLFSAAGLLTRLSTLCSFLLGCYLLGMQNSFAKTHHTESLLLLILLVLCFSRCGDGFSLDAIFKRNTGWWVFGSGIKERSWEYRWPVRLIWVIFVLAFCAAGTSKFWNSGLEWITSEYMATLLVNKGFTGDRIDPVVQWLPFWLGNRPSACFFLAAATVLLESFAPLALVNRYLRVIVVTGLFFMMVGFWIIMGVPFPQLLGAFVFWLPWDELRSVGERFFFKNKPPPTFC